MKGGGPGGWVSGQGGQLVCKIYVNQVWEAWVFTNHLLSPHPLDIFAQVP